MPSLQSSKASELAKNSIPNPQIRPKFSSLGYILLRIQFIRVPKIRQWSVHKPLYSALWAAHLYQTESRVPPRGLVYTNKSKTTIGRIFNWQFAIHIDKTDFTNGYYVKLQYFFVLTDIQPTEPSNPKTSAIPPKVEPFIGSMIFYIAVACGGFFVLILIIVMICCCVTRRRKRK